MQKHLYFICPTDYLEAVINETFKSENYFVTSLGNSIVFDLNKAEEINVLIETTGIREITFILSNDNQIILDALKCQEFSNISGLNNLYGEITRQKSYSKLLWQATSLSASIFSYHLNQKVKELKAKLSNWLVHAIQLNTKIYCRERAVFNEIHYDLINFDYLNLN